eukprot:TRINITY_DN2234_c0_g1_i2.p1 TRINITY_DN2234_c0_g1~~TRINITY_DN2234_c0_g1_i2.p1  ORF type:complete len:514 (+),score=117.28 TRINITY_DN2234_c0_g1_i2:94-1635(+)
MQPQGANYANARSPSREESRRLADVDVKDHDTTGTPSCDYVAGNLACLSNPCWFVFYIFVLIIFAPVIAVLHCCGYSHRFQLFALQRPDNCLAMLFLPILATIDWLLGDTYFDFKKRTLYGNNFISSGEVWMSAYADVSEALLAPQVRTFPLGRRALQKGNLPAEKRCVFLLALSDKGAGGNGYHEAFRAAIQDYLLDAEAVETRRTDATAEALLVQLEKEYQSMNIGVGGNFYDTYNDKGLMSFFNRYFHYVMFGLDPHDEAIQKPLRKFFIGAQILHYLQPFGFIFNESKAIDRVCEVYSKSPAFENFREHVPAHANITKRELCLLMVAIMRIAAVQGATTLMMVLLGGKPAIDFTKSVETGKNVPRSFLAEWDKLDLDDEEAVKRHILEVRRLKAPVSAAHRVATEAFTCNIAGKEYTFPMGTRIVVPVDLAGTDKAYWGDDAWEYDAQRSQLLESYLCFNSVGQRSGGRWCPGEKITMETAITLMQRLGRLRRQTLEPNSIPSAVQAEA